VKLKQFMSFGLKGLSLQVRDRPASRKRLPAKGARKRPAF
jgi:hypothetical protein